MIQSPVSTHFLHHFRIAGGRGGKRLYSRGPADAQSNEIEEGKAPCFTTTSPSCFAGLLMFVLSITGSFSCVTTTKQQNIATASQQSGGLSGTEDDPHASLRAQIEQLRAKIPQLTAELKECRRVVVATWNLLRAEVDKNLQDRIEKCERFKNASRRKQCIVDAKTRNQELLKSWKQMAPIKDDIPRECEEVAAEMTEIEERIERKERVLSGD